MTLLEETLKSHKTAMALNAENTDVMFNTAQVLTSLAEELESEIRTSDAVKEAIRVLLVEADELLTKCLASQQQEYEQMRIDIAKAQAEQEQQDPAQLQQGTAEASRQDDMETSSTTSSTPGDWAVVEEPLTPETILETCTAQLDVLTLLLGLYDLPDLPSIEPRAQYGLQVANTVIPTLINFLNDNPFQKPKDEPSGPTLSLTSSTAEEDLTTSPKDDAFLAVANFQAALAEIAYRNNQTTAPQYATAIESLFSSLTQPPQTPNQNPAYLNALAAYADALIELASAITDHPTHVPSSPTFTSDLETQWTALTTAQTILTQLSKPPNTTLLPASRLADTFLARGDTDLHRFRLASSEVAKPVWMNSKATLVANAGVFYRGARSYAEKAAKMDVYTTANAKAVVAEVMKETVTSGGVPVGRETWKREGDEVKRVLEQMVEEGILGREEAEGILGLVQ